MRDKEEQLHINKSSIQQEDITVINIYILNEAIKAYEVKTNRFKRRNRPFYTDSQRFQGPTHNNEQDNQTEDKSENRGFKPNNKPTRFNRHTQNTPLNNNKMHILLKCL